MQKRGITLVLDVGANHGQFATSLREQLGYRGRIVSFEPLKDAFLALQTAASNDPLWTCHNIALGEADGSAMINVSANSHSSSILDVSERSVQIEPGIGYVRKEEITICRLDHLLASISKVDDVLYLKVDTQGYEMNVLQGALGVIDRFELIQLETSFFPVYQDEKLVGDVMKFMDYVGYRVISIEPGWDDPQTGELLQADFIFGRK